MKHIKLLITLFLLTNSLLVGTDLSESPSTQGISLSIRFSEPAIYKVNDSIYIDIELKNNQTNPAGILIAEDKRYTFDFELVSLQNKTLPHNKNYSNFFNRVQPIFNSLLRLNQDEGFTYRVLLNDYYDINFTGQYYIRAVLYPSLKLSADSTQNYVKSNYLTINVRPGAIEDNYIAEKYEAEKEKMLQAEKKAPDEVIEYMLDARMSSQWEKFFLYIDIPNMIMSNTKFRERFRKADTERQALIITEYKEYMKQNTIDEISLVPVTYSIVKTEYSNGEAKVEAILKFKQYDFYEDKYYTYFLNKKDDKWFVTSYNVLNIGTR